MHKKSKYLHGPEISPRPIDPKWSVAQLIDDSFNAYNGGRLRESCKLFVDRVLEEDVTVGLSVSGALTPAGLGQSALIPLMEAGFVDWIISTGANLFHDTHFALGYDMHRGSPFVDDVKVFADRVVRIYDIFMKFEDLVSLDKFYQRLVCGKEFQKEMSTAEFHYLCGKYVGEREKALGLENRSFLAAAHRLGVPIYTSSPGDSAIGMNVASMALNDNKLKLDICADVNETTAIVFDAKFNGRKAAAVMLGGGSPKNFLLQTEPQIQEILGFDEKGFDYFMQFTDARPDTGGLSGATPGEAVSWGKVDPDMLPRAIVTYVDSTIALPLLTTYALERHEPRKLKRLYDRRIDMVDGLAKEYHQRVPAVQPLK